MKMSSAMHVTLIGMTLKTMRIFLFGTKQKSAVINDQEIGHFSETLFTEYINE